MQLLVFKIVRFIFERKPCGLVRDSRNMGTELVHSSKPATDELSVNIRHGIDDKVHMKVGTFSIFRMCAICVLIIVKVL